MGKNQNNSSSQYDKGKGKPIQKGKGKGKQDFKGKVDNRTRDYSREQQLSKPMSFFDHIKDNQPKEETFNIPDEFKLALNSGGFFVSHDIIYSYSKTEGLTNILSSSRKSREENLDSLTELLVIIQEKRKHFISAIKVEQMIKSA